MSTQDVAIGLGSIACALLGFLVAYASAHAMDLLSRPAERRRRRARELAAAALKEQNKNRIKVLNEIMPKQSLLCHHHERHEGDDNDDEDLDSVDDCVCAICLEKLEEDDDLIQGKECTHQYHRECMLGWLIKHNECPRCRKKMYDEEEFAKRLKAVENKNRGGSQDDDDDDDDDNVVAVVASPVQSETTENNQSQINSERDEEEGQNTNDDDDNDLVQDQQETKMMEEKVQEAELPDDDEPSELDVESGQEAELLADGDEPPSPESDIELGQEAEQDIKSYIEVLNEKDLDKHGVPNSDSHSEQTSTVDKTDGSGSEWEL